MDIFTKLVRFVLLIGILVFLNTFCGLLGQTITVFIWIYALWCLATKE